MDLLAEIRLWEEVGIEHTICGVSTWERSPGDNYIIALDKRSQAYTMLYGHEETKISFLTLSFHLPSPPQQFLLRIQSEEIAVRHASLTARPRANAHHTPTNVHTQVPVYSTYTRSSCLTNLRAFINFYPLKLTLYLSSCCHGPCYVEYWLSTEHWRRSLRQQPQQPCIYGAVKMWSNRKRGQLL